MMISKIGVFSIVGVGLMVFSGMAMASPPVPPPVEGFGITTAVDAEMSSGDFTEVETFTWTWVNDAAIPGPISSDLDGQMRLGPTGRAAQIRYTEEMQSTDTSFFVLNKDFAAASEGADPAGNNLNVAKDYGYVASEASLIVNASNQERVGLSIVANGDAWGLNDMPSLCPWAQGRFVPATNEFIAMGSDTNTTNVMVSDTDTEAVATRAPELNHSIAAQGTGMAQGLMQLSLMEGNSMYSGLAGGDFHFMPGWANAIAGPPNLVSKTDYSEKTQSVGTIDKFAKAMHYHSTIPVYQLPEPWYELQ